MPTKTLKPAKDEVVTGRIAKALGRELDALARAMDRSKSYVVAEAIQDYVALNRWQVAGIKEALVEAKAGRFADPAAVAAIFKKAGATLPGGKRR